MASQVPAGFTVIALVAAFNEEDVIDQVVSDLIAQGVDVYLIDDGSTDRTASVVAQHIGSGLLDIERRPPSHEFDWTSLLHRKEELARDLQADWFLHQDADEFRESPWADLNLREALWHVDRCGYNAVDHKVLNFRPTSEDVPPGDIRETLRFYEPASIWDRVQIKAWKKQPFVDLASVGGHDARFEGRRIFPIRFLSRHYPVRSQAHGVRKVFTERRPRFSAREREQGWHVQYDAMDAGHSFVRNPLELIAFDPVEARIELTLERRDSEAAAPLDPLSREPQARLELAEAESAAYEHDLARTRAELATSRHALAGALGDLAAAMQHVEDARVELAQQVEHARAEAASLRTTLSETTSRYEREAEDLRQALLVSSETTRRGEEHVAYFQSQLREYAAELARLQAEVDALRASGSWRITAPLRTLYGFARRSPKAGPRPMPARLTPVSDVWGVDRGQPVDRYYIDRFLRSHRADVRGRVLEVKDPGYTQMLDDGHVVKSDVLDVDRTNRRATIFADLAEAGALPAEQFDCFILTQTLHIIYDIRSAVAQAVRALKPGGVLLCTFPAVSRVNYEDGGLVHGDYWRLTQAAIRRLFEDPTPSCTVEISTFGNVATCTAFLYGLASSEVPAEDLDFVDPWFPLIHCVRAVRT